MSIFNAFMFENLLPLYPLSEGTMLYIYPPSKTLYVVKRLPSSYHARYLSLSTINSPHLAKVLYIHEEPEGIAVVTKYISGESLESLIQGGRCLPQEQAVRIIAQVCEGLEAMHRAGLVHRDVTPGNIVLTPDGNAKLIDFGIMRSYTEEKSSDTVILGTPGYAAPEQFGFTQSNPQTDIYAVGVLLNVLLTGKLPGEKRAAGPLGRIVAKCIEIDAAKRYETMRHLMVAVRQKLPRPSPADRLLKGIPGLRSSHTPTVIFAAFCYIFAILLSAAHFSELGKSIRVSWGLLSYLTSTVIPFLCYHNPFDVWDKLPFTAGADLRTKQILYYTLGTLSLLCGVVLFGVLA